MISYVIQANNGQLSPATCVGNSESNAFGDLHYHQLSCDKILNVEFINTIFFFF